MNAFKIYYDDDTSITTSANGTLEQFTAYLMQMGGVDTAWNPHTGEERHRQIIDVRQIHYHVFANGYDDFYPNYAKADEVYEKLIKEGRVNVRLYWEIEEDGETIEEDFIKGQGDFPL